MLPIPSLTDNCKTGDWTKECCFCKPNGIRSSQLAIWIPATRNAGVGTSNISVSNVVSSSTQADAINLHGEIHGVVVRDVYVRQRRHHFGPSFFLFLG